MIMKAVDALMTVLLVRIGFRPSPSRLWRAPFNEMINLLRTKREKACNNFEILVKKILSELRVDFYCKIRESEYFQR